MKRPSVFQSWSPLLLTIFLLSGSVAVDAASPFVVCADENEMADKDKNNKKGDKKGKGSQPEEPVLSITKHEVTIDGKKIACTATAGKLLMKNDAGDAKANVFFVAYTKDGAEAEKRPVTFCFNGGPGSSSVWLHLGMLGPQRVKMSDTPKPLHPPHQLIANPYSMLDQTDLVFIDPVSTGFSRPAKGEKKQQFHGYDEDLRSVGQFIHDYTTKYGRWGSPKFLLGESYGGLRAAGLSGELQNRYRMYLNGIVLVSAVVDFRTIRQGSGNDLAYSLFLPTYAATAWYHKALSEELQSLSIDKVVAQAEEFARESYMQALVAGDSLSDDDRTELISRMSELTGLSPEYLDRVNLRVSMGRFGKELLRSRKQVIGRFDSRYTGTDADHVGDSVEHDPSASVFFGPFTSAMNQYLRDSLKVEEEGVYEILTRKVHPWDYSEFTNGYVSASSTLRTAMRNNPFLKVFAACGYYDLATPSFAMEYTRDHLNLPPEVRENFTMGFYEGGHMMYVHEPSLKKLRADLTKFYQSALQTSDTDKE